MRVLVSLAPLLQALACTDAAWLHNVHADRLLLRLVSTSCFLVLLSAVGIKSIMKQHTGIVLFVCLSDFCMLLLGRKWEDECQ